MFDYGIHRSGSLLLIALFCCAFVESGWGTDTKSIHSYDYSQIVSETPTASPLPTPTPTFVPIDTERSAWEEYGPGSASGLGISDGYGDPKRMIAVCIGTDGYPVVGWDHKTPGEQSSSFVKKWNGNSWEYLDCDPAEGLNIARQYAAIFRLVVDPADGQIIASMDDYRNYLMKYDDGEWRQCFQGGINDGGGLEWFTELAFLPDWTPIAFYTCGYGPSFTYYRVQKFSDGGWTEFNPGSAQGWGIGDSDRYRVAPPQMIATDEGEVFALWFEIYNGKNTFYIKKWDGEYWTLVGGSASGFGVPEGAAGFSSRPMALDSSNLPIVTYRNNDTGGIYVKRFDGRRWIEMGDGSASGSGLCEVGSRGYNSILLNGESGYPVVIWIDSDTRELYAKRFNGIYWDYLKYDDAETSAIGHDVHYYDAAMGPDGTVIVAYDTGDGRDVYVSHYSKDMPTPISMVPTPTPTPEAVEGWMVLDGFGGVHTTSSSVEKPDFPYFYPFDIVRDVEPDPLGRGWYMLDGYGGIHTSSPDLPKPNDLPYFGFDIARNLEIRNGSDGLLFYMLDGFGTIHTNDTAFDYGELPWFGADIARDLEPDRAGGNGWSILDAYGVLHSSTQSNSTYPVNVVWFYDNPARGLVQFKDSSNVVIDAYAGRHTSPIYPAYNVVDGLPDDFYFPGWGIIWDVEVVK